MILSPPALVFDGPSADPAYHRRFDDAPRRTRRRDASPLDLISKGEMT
jgi:hypothetical protein